MSAPGCVLVFGAGGWAREQHSFGQELRQGQGGPPEAGASPGRERLHAGTSPAGRCVPGQGQGQAAAPRSACPGRAVPDGAGGARRRRRAVPSRAVWEEPAGSAAPAPPHPTAAAFRGRPPRSRARGGMMDPRLRLLTPRARQPAVNGGGR